MPYIKPEDRNKFKRVLIEIQYTFEKYGCTPGDLNYIISSLCKEYLIYKGESYTFHNDIVGVLNSVIQEWYRRKTAPYENKKIEENGDIF